MIRIGLIGCGYWGPNLARNIAEAPQAELAAVSDLDPARLDLMKRRYPGVRVTTRSEELTEAPDIDAVVLATPVGTHHALGVRALERGKHLLVEKPMTRTAAEAEELVAMADRHQRVLMVDHTFVYTGAVRKIKELVDSDQLGELYYLDSVRINLGLVQRDVNVVVDLAPHDLSIADYLLGRQAKGVIATGSAHAGQKFEDIAYLSLDFGASLIANFHVSWLSPVKIRQMILGGSKKTVIYNDLEPSEKVRVYDRGIDVTPGSVGGIERLNVSYRLGDAWIPALDLTEGLRLVMAHFIDCIENKRQPLTDGLSGLRIVRLLEAAQASVKAGGKRVNL